MRRVEIWTVYGDHLVFNNVMLAGPSEGERFFCIRRDDRTDYIPAYDIKKAQVVDDGADKKYRSDYRPRKRAKKEDEVLKRIKEGKGLKPR